jgi:cytochrome c oxidase subunit 2
MRPLAALPTALAMALVFPLQALADTATPEAPASPETDVMADVYFAILGVTITIFVLVGGWLLYSAIRFRERPGDPDVDPPQIHGSTRLELGWTIVPLVILIGLAGYTISNMGDVSDQPEADITVDVTAFQFGWEFEYSDGTKPSEEANTLVVPVGKTVVLELTSRDVIHDWWVPELAQKVDVMPGRTTETWFTADHTGSFQGQCAEFCGSGHSIMLITVKVVSDEEYAKLGSVS